MSLFWYLAFAPAEKSVLAAVYDDPFENLNLNNQESILEKQPALQDGDIRLEPAPVQPGDWLADAQGTITVLAGGVRYRPSGCTAPDCALEYSGDQAATLDQVVIRFRLKPGLVWSDGQPLSAADSLYSYELAQALQPEAWLDVLQATQSYQAVDDVTTEWRGVPGYQGGAYGLKFFLPLPRHAWGGLGLDEVSNTASRAPLGWGAYQLESWQSGVQITLRKNPYYLRAAEGRPHFDRLVFRFIPAAPAALQALRSGECDLLDPTGVSEAQIVDYLALQAAGEAHLLVQPNVAWEQLTLGISSYNAQTTPKLAQKEVRQALAACLDRAAITSQVLGGLATPAYSFLPPGYPGAVDGRLAAPYDPQAGMRLLTAAGWLDLDNNPTTPRTAQGVPGMPDGTGLALLYRVSPETERQQTASLVQAALQVCGFGVEIVTQPFAEYLASGPDGPVFGRKFDLAQFAWPAAGESLCALYLTSQIPGPYPEFPLGWGGGNASGYSSLEFDQACQALLNDLPEAESKRQALVQAQTLLAQDVPVLPLYWRFRMALTRTDVCGLVIDQTIDNPLWNIEELDRGEACDGK